MDRVKEKIGFKYFWIENNDSPEDGFYLNGKKHPLRGVNRHSFIKGSGSAMTEENIYPGWYPDANFYGSFEEVVNRKRKLDSRPFALSEYG